MSLQEAAGVTADGGASSASSTAGDLTTCTESDEEQHVDLRSCDEAATARVDHLQATGRAVKMAMELARRLVKAWLWNDKFIAEAAVRQLGRVTVSRQVVMGSGLMQVLQMRKETLWDVLSDGYRSRVASTYSGWLKKLKAGKDADVEDGDIKAKSLLGAYANCPGLFQKRCQDLGHWLMDQSLWEASVLLTRKVATVLVAHDVPTWEQLHSATGDEMAKWLRDEQCVVWLKPLVANEVAFREEMAKRGQLALDGPAKVVAGVDVLKHASGDHLLKLHDCLKEVADDLKAPKETFWKTLVNWSKLKHRTCYQFLPARPLLECGEAV